MLKSIEGCGSSVPIPLRDLRHRIRHPVRQHPLNGNAAQERRNQDLPQGLLFIDVLPKHTHPFLHSSDEQVRQDATDP